MVSSAASLEFPEAFLDDVCRILRSESVSVGPTPGKTMPFLNGRWTLVAGRWQPEGSRSVVELDVTNEFGDLVCVEVRAENFQRELSRDQATDGSETPYEELVADITSLFQELLIPKKRIAVDRLVLPSCKRAPTRGVLR